MKTFKVVENLLQTKIQKPTTTRTTKTRYMYNSKLYKSRCLKTSDSGVLITNNSKTDR